MVSTPSLDSLPNHVVCDHEWHDTKPHQPTHQEIMTKWWKLDNGRWVRVATYDKGTVNYGIWDAFGSLFIGAAWFEDRESRDDYPPE